ncbi:hypothetical protein BDV96DRAFT_616369 [Lophiotrema nucula]|uniref:Uncharacterized protein n=1 Tax=Lophiotrema nucula TaxID=690887 RepID=A0A6A5YNK6_9PLEO|nr:hypothetical protein BDV96DRAFT_616369 [Lophiotrema nucula]
MELASHSRTKLPGFGLPVQTLPKWSRAKPNERFPHAIADYYATYGITMRERRMLDFMTQITDKPEWERKVFDEEIVGKWKEEGVRWDEELDENGDWWLSEKMFECCMLELREKAERFKETGFVAVLDAEATIVKSDSAITEDLRVRLKDAVWPIEDVPERLKDWHPYSAGQVLDLVHPSLFPVSFGLTRALPRGTVPLENCIEYIGKGDPIPEFTAKTYTRQVGWSNDQDIAMAWGSYQWLPSNISIAPDEKPKIDSYINNLHPQANKDLYAILEQFVDASIPLWNECLSWFHCRIRIDPGSTGNEDYEMPEGVRFPRDQYRNRTIDPDDPPDAKDEEEEEMDDRDWAMEHDCDDEYNDWWEANRKLTYPEPNFVPRVELEKKEGAKPIDLRKDFPNGLQVIFKFANIILDPEDLNPHYDGGSWHVEGSLNEHICATALYYYDSENIEDSSLAFRQSFDVEEMTMKPAQFEYKSAEVYYGIANEESSILELGSVKTSQGRLLAFPNVLQHQVQPFGLADESKVGYRKILAMFLIDPHIPVLSTANVPPQRKDWWAEEVRKVGRFAEIPEEVFEMIIDAVEGFPISWDEACEIREKLMGERGAAEDDLNDKMESDTFYFCEH